MAENYIERLRKYESYLIQEKGHRPLPSKIVYQLVREELRKRFPELAREDDKDLAERVTLPE